MSRTTKTITHDDLAALCIHGLTHEQRKRDGCAMCDQDRTAQAQCERDVAAFRARVVATARAVLPSVVAVLATGDPDGIEAAPYAFIVAEAFERAADEYLKNGGKA